MWRLNDMITTRKAQIASGTERANNAESIIKEKETKLNEQNKLAEDLGKRVELAKQRNQLSKELLAVLQRLDEARKKLGPIEDKCMRVEDRIQSLHAEADSFESRYRNEQKIKNSYEELVREMDILGIN